MCSSRSFIVLAFYIEVVEVHFVYDVRWGRGCACTFFTFLHTDTLVALALVLFKFPSEYSVLC